MRGFMEPLFWLLSLAGMAVYFFNRGWPPGHPLFVSKGFAVLFLLCLAARYAAGRYTSFSRNVIIGLAFGVAGDIYLVGSGAANNFLAGLICFLIGHIFYIAAFRVPGRPLNRKAAVAVGIPGMAVLAVLLPPVLKTAPVMAGPVGVYGIVILVMVYFGVTRGMPVLAVGAVLFAVSDTFLAYNRFVAPHPVLPVVVWSTYYAGQALITLSVKRQDAPRSPEAG